ncbi:MAG: DUF885 family protein [Planctomycetes bacterium]|nr:DUF885 family protein [Planctomycetota bacterium]
MKTPIIKTFAASGVVVFAISCAATPPWRDPVASGGSVETALVEWRDAAGAMDPGAATARGDHRFDSQLDPTTPQFIARVRELLNRAKQDLDALEGIDLSPNAAADRALLLLRVEADLLAIDKIRPFERDPLWTLQIVSRALTSIENCPDLAPAERIAAFTNRLAGIPAYLQQSRAGMYSPSQVHAETALELVDALDSYLAEGDLGQRLQSNANVAFAENINSARAAVESHRKWLLGVVAVAPGGWHHRMGRANFSAFVHAESGLSMSAEQIAELGERELEGARKQFLIYAKAACPQAATPDDAANAALARVSDTRAIDGAGLQPIGKNAIDEARELSAGGAFATYPSGFAVTANASRARHGSALTGGEICIGKNASNATFEVAAPLDRMGIGDRTSWFSTLTPLRLRLAALEELAPGKGLARAARAQNSSAIRRDVALAAWDLGWGDYARRNAAEPMETLEQVVMAHEDMLVAMRAIAAARIHGGSMSISEATDLFRRRCFLDGAVATREARRCAVEPSLALELVGRVEIEEIVDQLHQRKALSRMTINNLLLQKGALPLPVLRSLVL